jgi:hypothetical protein
MTQLHTSGPENPTDQIAVLQGILQRIAQAEHPIDFTFLKQVLLERVAELEEVAHTLPANS